MYKIPEGSIGREIEGQILGVDDNNFIRPFKVNASGQLLSILTDSSGRSGINGVFGGSLMLQKRAYFSGNFIYGADTRTVDDLSINGGSVGVIDNLLFASSGTAINGSGAIQTKRRVRYVSGKDAEILGTLMFSPPRENNRQLGGIFDDFNGFAIGYEGTTFSAFRKRDGVLVDKIAQSNFNVDSIDGNGISKFNLNPQYINVFRIVYGYLGVATAYFEVYDGDKFIPFHKIKLTNAQQETHIVNPYLAIRLESTNFGNTTDVSIKSGSFYAGMLDGETSDSSARRFAIKQDSLALSQSTDAVLAVFHNKPLFGGSIRNTIEDLFHTIAVGATANKPIVVSAYKLKETPTDVGFVDKDIFNSNMRYSFTSTIDLTGAELLASFVLGENGQINQDISSSRHTLFPGEYAAITYSASSGASGELSYSIQWDELF